MAGVRVANVAVRFLLELGALAALAWWGVSSGEPGWGQILLGVGAPGLAAAVWGFFVAPNAWFRVRDPFRLGIEAVVFGAAMASLVGVNRAGVGAVFGVVAVVHLGLMVVLGQRGEI